MKNNNIGCLILHGFAGTRKDVAMLAEKVAENGYKISVPLLAGHEASRKELARVSYVDWIKSGEDALVNLEKSCDEIVILGFSMGGLIGANLCQRHKVRALIFINTPIYCWNMKHILINLIHNFNFYSNKYIIACTAIPLHALIEFSTILFKTKPLFFNINISCMVNQVLDDDTVNPKSAYYIYSKIAGEKIINKYQTGGHMVFLTNTGNEICKDICMFLDRM